MKILSFLGLKHIYKSVQNKFKVSQNVPEHMLNSLTPFVTNAKKCDINPNYGSVHVSFIPENPRGKNKMLVIKSKNSEMGFDVTEGLETMAPECNYVTISNGSGFLTVDMKNGKVKEMCKKPFLRFGSFIKSMQGVVDKYQKS